MTRSGSAALHGDGWRRGALLGSEVAHLLGISKAEWSALGVEPTSGSLARLQQPRRL
ncbi:hypothetical protein OAO87_00660 [bacterium]|nr:hypothetical protein [bacterium]